MISEKRYNELMKMTGNHLITIYIPTRRVGNVEEDQILFKNKLKEVQMQLLDSELTPPEVERMLKPAVALQEDGPKWSKMSDGLAVFIGPDFFEYYQVPVHFEPFIHIGNRFMMHPMYEGIEGRGLFYLLALSMNDVRFFECRKHSITPIVISDKVPADMEKALALDEEPTLQHHSSGQAIFHGQGGGKELDPTRMKQYFRMVDEGITDIIPKPDGPMVVACTEELFPLFEEVNTYPKLYPRYIAGNPDDKDPVLLHEEAVVALSEWFTKERNEDTKRFEAALADSNASFNPHEIVPAAVAGRIDTLFVVRDAHTWGTYDAESHEVSMHKDRTADSECLVETTMRHALKNGARIHVVTRDQMPRPTANVNAVLRF